eukprot:scaffold29073_cov184-Amphora_coffeaeformis.AAC.1
MHYWGGTILYPTCCGAEESTAFVPNIGATKIGGVELPMAGRGVSYQLSRDMAAIVLNSGHDTVPLPVKSIDFSMATMSSSIQLFPLRDEGVKYGFHFLFRFGKVAVQNKTNGLAKVATQHEVMKVFA